jgi:hypothetical protein
MCPGSNWAIPDYAPLHVGPKAANCEAHGVVQAPSNDGAIGRRPFWSDPLVQSDSRGDL